MDRAWVKFKDKVLALPILVTLPVAILVFLLLALAARAAFDRFTGPPERPGGGSVSCSSEFDPTCEEDLEPRGGG